MTLVNILTVLYLVLVVVCYIVFIQNSGTQETMGVKKKINWLNLGILLMLGLIVRYILACIDSGYESDMNCFSYWADMVYRDGIGNFYTAEVFTDYPPGYMYVLWVIGAIRSMIPSLADSTILVKMPAMICDLITAGLVYKIAHKRFNEISSVLFAGFYLFNPVVLIDSAMWGQVDSVFTMLVAIVAYLAAERKLIPSYFVFAIAVLVKPQALILTPILLCAILDQVFFHDFKWKRFWTELGMGLLAIAMMVLLAVPFGVKEVWAQYLKTMGEEYPKATVNAYNLWAMFGLNWHEQTEVGLGLQYSTWGAIFIVLIVAACLVFCYLSRKKQNGEKYFFYGAFVGLGFFTLSVRVHERYMFPVLILLLLAYLYKPRKNILYAFLLLTLVATNNVWHAFKFYDVANFDWEAVFPRVVGLCEVCVFAFVAYLGVRYYIIERNEEKSVANGKKLENIVPSFLLNPSKEPKIFASDKKLKFTKQDWIAVLAITIIYGVIALSNLGNMNSPETHWDSETMYDQTLVFDVSNKQGNITEIEYFLGNYESRSFSVHQSADGVNWYLASVNGGDTATQGEEASKFTMDSVFCWGSTPVTIVEPYVRLVCNSDKTVINELVLRDETGNSVIPVNASQFEALFDEQDLCPEISTFRDSTYFDEIYHARTAYEMTKPGTYCYENTHPPLGKFFISIGIRIFGMCPFGWRIVGTLFGIAMLPFFYLFTKKLFRETWIAAVTTTLFAADFMHFAQTRIATIDVYVTFFIILMYYFMYQYTRMSFYDTSLKKTFIPLLCCGISMGLGCASKWPGVYAGIGLAVLFFATMLRRYLEYRYASQNPTESTNGIEHSGILSSFRKNLIKTLAFCILAFIVIPVTIYTASYIAFDDSCEIGLISYVTDTQPADEEGNTISTVPLSNGETISIDSRYTKVAIKRDLGDPESFTGKLAIKWNGCYFNRLLGRMVRNQETMFSYHSALVAEHPFSSWWYEWPLMLRPIWYYTKTIDGNIQENISAFGNPMVWWAGIPAFIAMIYFALRDKDRKSGFLCIGYLAQLVPWMNVSRITFIYHYFPSVPFITIMIGYTMYRIVKLKEEEKYQKIGKYVCIAYAVGAVALFALYYPILSGYPIDAQFVADHLRWLERWQLVSI